MLGRRRRTWMAALLAGLLALTALVAWQGAGAVLESLGRVGPRALWLAPLFLAPGLSAALSWRHLFPPDGRPARGLASYATWIGLGVNWLLPVAQIGGELAKVRLLLARGFGSAPATASVVADKTLQAVTQVIFALAGLGLLALHVEGGGGTGAGAGGPGGSGPAVGPGPELSSEGSNLLLGLLAAVALLSAAIYAFYRLQRSGVFARSAGWLRERLPGLRELLAGEAAARVDEALEAVYARPSRWGPAFLWRMAFRVLLTTEVLLVAGWLGHPVGLAEAVILESLAQAARAAAFLVPAGLGAQEGGIVLVGLAVGLPPDAALVLSLAKRARELVVGLPALLAWQAEEGRGLLRD